MSQPFAVFDIDGTVFRSSLVLEMTYRAINAGILPKTILKEIELKRSAWLKRESSDAYEQYIQQIVDSFLNNIAGVEVAKMQSIAKTVVEEQHQHTYVYTRDLIKALKEEGYFLIALTGSPNEIAHEFSKRYDFDVIRSTEYYSKNGIYTGLVHSNAKDKHIELQKIIEQFNLSAKNSIAVGDSGGDISMLKLVENPIAFNPDKVLFDAANQNGWKIIVERKNMIYKLEKKDGHYILAKTND